MSTQNDLVASLEETFRPSYMPAVFTDFMVRREVDFRENFSNLVKPLMDEGYLAEKDGYFTLTNKGKKYIKDVVDLRRHKQTELQKRALVLRCKSAA